MTHRDRSDRQFLVDVRYSPYYTPLARDQLIREAALDDTPLLRSTASMSPLSSPPPPPLSAPLARGDVRSASIERARAMLCGHSESLGDILGERLAKRLGSGTYGSVFSFQADDDGTALALKQIPCESMSQTLTVKRQHAEMRQEPELALALTKHLVIDSRYRMPNLLVSYGYEFTANPLVFVPLDSDDSGVLRPVYTKSAPTTVQLVSELCLGGSLVDHLRSLGPDPRIDTACESAREFCGALVLQALMAVVALGAADVLHLDAVLSNLFVRSVATECGGCVQYDFGVADDDGENETLSMPTDIHIPLLVLGDYGLATVHAWQNDWRLRYVRQCRLAAGASHTTRIARTYSDRGTNRWRWLRDGSRLLGDSTDPGAHRRPMTFRDLGEYERDFAALLSGFYHEAAMLAVEGPERYWCSFLRDFSSYALHILGRHQPADYAGQRKFVAELFSQSPHFWHWSSRADPTPIRRHVVWKACVPDAGDEHTELRENVLDALETACEKREATFSNHIGGE